MRKRLLLLSFCFINESIYAQSLSLHGLSADKALISIQGRHEMLRHGRPSRSGVLLKELRGQEALVEWRGQRYRLSLSRRINSRFAESRQELALQQREDQAYIAPLQINGQAMQAIVDTGASLIAMNHFHAKSLGIDFRSGERGTVTTASGQAQAWFVRLHSVAAGGVVVNNVRAAVTESAYPLEILLGMSFLNHVSLQERHGILYLREKD